MEIKAYRVPNYGEEPPEGMVEFLAECQQPWDGDDCGISLEVGGVCYQAEPGDWIVKGVGYVVMDHEEYCVLTGWVE